MKKIYKYFIDKQIFDYKFIDGCNINKCSGECCYNGVYVDIYHTNEILSVKDEIIDLMDDSQNKNSDQWFEEKLEDKDFKSGFCTGTQVYNNKCVFLDKVGFCSLQKLAVNKGEHKWKYKPLYCILYPLAIYENSITVDSENLVHHNYCNKSKNHTSTVFDCCKEELEFLLNSEKYNELVEYRNEHCNSIKTE